MVASGSRPAKRARAIVNSKKTLPDIMAPWMIDLDLFAGAGGLAIGLKMAGFTPTQMYEMDKHSCETLRGNAEGDQPTIIGKVHEGDVQKVDWATVDDTVRLLAAGAPCQPFSLGGKHRAQHDGRNLFPEVLRAMRSLRPQAVLLENVRGLVRKAFLPYFDYILRQLECPSIEPKPNELWQSHDERIRRHQCSPGYEPEYEVTYRVLDAADYGVPQSRLRVFIVATRKDFPRYKFPAKTHSKAALMRAQKSGDYWTARGLPKPKISPGNGHQVESDELLPWVTVRDALAELADPPASEEGTSKQNHWVIPGARMYAGHSGSIMDWPSKTIKAGVHGVPGGENTLVMDNGKIRYFTLRETAKMQSFPDRHFFEGARIHVTRQIGNAVPCELAAAVARPLFTLLIEKQKASR
jgi:DNA (cytosine-5)-methyltransferase 1